MTALIRAGSRVGFDRMLIDSPRNRNALSLELLEAAVETVRRSVESDSRGLLIQHTGPVFCSGVDLKERRLLPASDTSHSSLLAELLRAVWHHPKPVVVQLDGAVRGGGLGIVACADVVLASSRSTFAYSESRVGVAPALVMAVTVPTTPSRSLMPYLLDGEEFVAATAHRLGLVSHIVDSEDADVVDAVLARLGRGAPGAQAVIKRLARQWAGSGMDALIEEMTALSAHLFASEEAAEGMAAFSERRAPAWVATGEEAAS
jgi:methylglutaconyl-CoA hydratase